MPLTPEEWRNEQLVGTSDNTDTQSVVTQLTNGNIVVVWADSNGGGEILGRIYDSRGNAVGAEFQLNTNWQADLEFLPSVTALSDGGFAISYNSFAVGGFGQEWDIHLEEFNASGSHRNGVTIVNDSISDFDYYQFPKMAQASSTSLMVAYTFNQDDLRFKIYDPSTNTVGSEVTVWTGSTTSGEGVGSHDVAALTGGTYAVAFVDPDASSNQELYVSRYNSAGTTLGSSLLSNDVWSVLKEVSVAPLTNGNFVVSYTVDNSGGSNEGIRYQLVSAGGTSLSGEQSPLTTTAGNQSISEVVALPDGEFLVLWFDEDTLDIHGQRIASNGTTRIGTEFDVINYGSSPVKKIDAVYLEDGRVAVAFNSDINGTSDRVYLNIWDTRDAANDTPAYTDDQVIGTLGADTINPVPLSTDNIFTWNGDDTVWFNFDNEFSVDYDGGTGSDRLGLLNAGVYSFTSSEIISVETLQYNNGGTTGTRDAAFYVDDFTFSTVDFAQDDVRFDILRLYMGVDTTVNLTGLTLTDYDSDEVAIYIYGDGSNETITGTTGNDSIYGGAGDDSVNGGSGHDTFNMSGGYTTSTTVDLVADTIVSGGVTEDIVSIESISGSPQNDTITGDSAANTLLGNSGSDVLRGGLGNDVLDGGAGDDRIIVTPTEINAGVETLDGGANTDTLVLLGTSTGNQNLQVTNETLAGFEEIEFAGTEAAGDVNLTGIFNAVQFNSGAVSLTALIDGYTVSGNTETLRISMGTETALDLSGLTFVDWGAQGEVVQIFGDSDSETITGTSQVDDISLSTGNDTAYGGAGNDTLQGGSGIDRLYGGTGADRLDGGLDNDVYYVDNVSDTIVNEIGFSLGGGIDTVYASLSWTLGSNLEVLRLEGAANINGTGNAAPENLVGNTGQNLLTGNGGNDIMNGKSGNDTLDGGTGQDTLVGEAGNDTFYYDAFADSYAGAATRDFINGFVNGSDLIDLSAIDANPFSAGDQAFQFIGTNAFGGTGASSAGQLRWFTFGGGNFNIVEADWNGDGVAEMQIFVNLTNTMSASDFIL